MVHETAIVHPTALVHPKADVGPYSVIGPGCVIHAKTKIGAHCTLGGPPEHRHHWHSWRFGVHIGERCFISNGVTIDSGTERDTVVMNDTAILRNAHVGHDAIVYEKVTLSCNSIVGGFSIVMQSANCGLGSIIHQNCVVGPLAMLGMGCIVTKKTPIEPMNIYAGNPAKFMKKNQHGIDSAGYTDQQLRDMKHAYYIVVQK